MVEIDMVYDGLVLVSAVMHEGQWFLAREQTVYGLTDARGGPADFARAVRESIWPPPYDRWPPGAVFQAGDPSRWMRLSDANTLPNVSARSLLRRHHLGWLPTALSVGGRLIVRASHAAMPYPRLWLTDDSFEDIVGWSEPVIVRRGRIVSPSLK